MSYQNLTIVGNVGRDAELKYTPAGIAVLKFSVGVNKTIKVGDTLTRGNQIATSGNTGHSFAPHLHYQLMKGDKVIDPFKSHKTERASIAADQRAALDKEILRLRNTMPQTGAASL